MRTSDLHPGFYSWTPVSVFCFIFYTVSSHVAVKWLILPRYVNVHYRDTVFVVRCCGCSLRFSPSWMCVAVLRLPAALALMSPRVLIPPFWWSMYLNKEDFPYHSCFSVLVTLPPDGLMDGVSSLMIFGVGGLSGCYCSLAGWCVADARRSLVPGSPRSARLSRLTWISRRTIVAIFANSRYSWETWGQKISRGTVSRGWRSAVSYGSSYLGVLGLQGAHQSLFLLILYHLLHQHHLENREMSKVLELFGMTPLLSSH